MITRMPMPMIAAIAAMMMPLIYYFAAMIAALLLFFSMIADADFLSCSIFFFRFRRSCHDTDAAAFAAYFY